MDWKNKHFNQSAVFDAPREKVLEAARAVVADWLGRTEDTTGGFIARGFGAGHSATATIRTTQVPDGTQLSVELLVERASIMGYMLVDIGGYYNGMIDKWFRGISERLGTGQEQALVHKTTPNSRISQGCLAGCVAWIVAGACLTLLAIPIDRAVFPKLATTVQGPFAIAASSLGILVGGLAFVNVAFPEASTSQFIRKILQRNQKKE